MIKGSVTDKIYHGCTIGYANSKKKLIDFKKGDSCLLPTKDPFWAEPRNLKMQTRNSEKKIDGCSTQHLQLWKDY